MKMRIRTVVICLALAALLTACGNDAKVIEGAVQTSGKGSGEESAVVEGETGSSEDAQAQEETAAAYKGYTFQYNDVVVEIDAEAAPIVEKLGEAVSYFEAPSCAFEGIDKMYTYNGFELDTYPMNNKDYVSAVIFKDDVVATPEGVSIGDPAEKITEVYGEDMTEEKGMIIYMKDGMKLCFIAAGDSIASIEYRSTVLDE